MFSQASVSLSTIGLMPTWSLLILVGYSATVTMQSVRILLECYLVWRSFLRPATKLGHGYVFTRVCDSVHGGGGFLSRGGLCPGGVSVPGGSLSGGVSVRGACSPRTVMSGRYASYWNAFLLIGWSSWWLVRVTLSGFFWLFACSLKGGHNQRCWGQSNANKVVGSLKHCLAWLSSLINS